MLPTALLSGPKAGITAANRIVGAAVDYGQNQSISGAIAQLVIPKNTVAANIAQSTLGDLIGSK